MSSRAIAVIVSLLLIVHITVPYLSDMGRYEPLFWIMTSLAALASTLMFLRGEVDAG